MNTDTFNNYFNKKTKFSEYRSEVWRVVESQESAATLTVVDSHEEQDLLEAMLDVAKPVYREGTENMHYLLKTAFRYPPLKYGSRFGTQLMPSYLYASENYRTALCETAYYRFIFLDDMQTAYSKPIRSQFEIFSVLAASKKCLDLTASKFKKVQTLINDGQSYTYSHQIGEWASEQECEMIRFYSARYPDLEKKLNSKTKIDAINVALAEPKTIRSSKPRSIQAWQCLTIGVDTESSPAQVSFRSREGEICVFKRSDFCDKKGKLVRVA